MIAIAFALVALGIFFIPGATNLLEFDRAALANGQVWRVATGHFTHATIDHLLWDVVVFVVLGLLVERRSRRQLVRVIAVSALAISAAVFALEPQFLQYRGLSGIDSALFVAFVTDALVRTRDRRTKWSLVALLVAFAAKVIFEYAAGTTLFVDATAAMTPVPLAHVAGGLVGGGIVVATRTEKYWVVRGTSRVGLAHPMESVKF
ncbi:MAG: rhombosortase [Planctomycetota bacterium]